MVAKAILHLDGNRSPQGIEPVDRIAGHEGHAIDGVLRNEIPVDEVAEDFVDAYAVLVDRQSLRGSDHRRGGEAAIVEVALKLVSALVAERNAGQAPVDRIQQAWSFRVVE